jgi:hypothetical protein
MSSTRNKNTKGDYTFEQSIYARQFEYKNNAIYGEAPTTHLPSDSLLPSKLPKHSLSSNPEDIESFLFGIGSTNLVDAKPDVIPGLKQELPSLSMMDKRVPLIMPAPLDVKDNQRARPI